MPIKYAQVEEKILGGTTARRGDVVITRGEGCWVFGEDGKKFAQGFFEDVRAVRLERDHPGEIRDFYGRYLAYVFAKKNGEWVNYGVTNQFRTAGPSRASYGRTRTRCMAGGGVGAVS